MKPPSHRPQKKFPELSHHDIMQHITNNFWLFNLVVLEDEHRTTVTGLPQQLSLLVRQVTPHYLGSWEGALHIDSLELVFTFSHYRSCFVQYVF